MPRIEIIPNPHNPDDATPSVDCCQICSKRFREGSSSVPQEAKSDVADQGFNTASYRVGSTEVNHPPYEEGFFECVICGELLNAQDD